MPDEATTPGLFRRLKERRIVQWTIAYVAAAWVLLQVAELLFDIFAWPDVWLRRLTVALVFGFAAAVILAWYHGEKGQQRASRVELVLLAAVAAAAVFVFSTRDFATDDEISASIAKNLFEGRASRRITANTHYEDSPSWSPDSGSFVFVSERSGNRDLWLQPRGGTPTQLTVDEAEDAQPAWSPDGHTVLFVSSRGHADALDRSDFFGYTIGGDIWSIPAFGGDARQIIDDGFNPSWSPDGSRFAFDSSRGGSRRIWVADAGGDNLVQASYDEADLASHIRPAWSRDGDWIVYERQSATQAASASLHVVAVDGSTEFTLTDDRHRDMAPAWADEDSIVFASDRGGALNLWQIDVDLQRGQARGAPVQVTLGAGEDFHPAIAADGTLAYATLRRLENLWQVDVDPETLEFGDEPERLMEASWNDFAPALSSDGSRTVFTSDRGGQVDIWMTDGRSEPTRLTSLDGQDLQPVWSPDDSKLAFFSDARGNNDIYILPLNGAAPVPVTSADSNDINPYWSSDSSRLGFTSDRSGQSEVWVMNADGGDARQLTSIGTLGHTARWSPDDEWLLFTSIAEGDRDVWAVRHDGSELRRVTTASTQDAHGLWSADGRSVLYLSDHQAVYATDIAGEKHRLLFDLGETIDHIHLSRDGTVFQFTREKVEGDIWQIE